MPRPKKAPRTPLTITMRKDLHRELKLFAKGRGLDMSAVVDIAVVEHMRRWHANAMAGVQSAGDA